MHYAELHCKSNFSFLDGASHADELVARAQQLEYQALAVTDVNSLAGIVRAHAAAKEAGFQLIVGAEVTPVDAPPVVVWVPDRAAYGRLSRLLTIGPPQCREGGLPIDICRCGRSCRGATRWRVASVIHRAGQRRP